MTKLQDKLSASVRKVRAAPDAPPPAPTPLKAAAPQRGQVPAVAAPVFDTPGASHALLHPARVWPD